MTKKASEIIIGKIYTADTPRIAQGMAILNGKYLYVGSKEEALSYADEHTKITEFTEGLILPGMTDGHAHITMTTELLFGVSLYNGHTLDYYLNQVRQYILEHPNEAFITGKGFVNGAFDAIGPTADMLDSVSKDIPIILSAEDCHSVWVNSKALSLLHIDENTPDIENGEIVRFPGSRKPTGWLKEAACHIASSIIPPYTIEQYKEAILHYQEMALSQGITNVFEPLFAASKGYRERAEAYRQLSEEGKLLITCRLGYSIEPEDDIYKELEAAKQIRERLKDNKQVQLTTIKLFADGVLEGHTAFLLKPYADTETEDYGEPIWTQEALNDFAYTCQKECFLLHTHAIGDGAVEYVINAYEYAQKQLEDSHPLKGTKHNSITHLQLVNEQQKQRMAALNIRGVVNPYWHFKDSKYFDALEVPYLGCERAETEYPLASLQKAGIALSQASDFPVSVPADTFTSLHLMVNRTEPGNPSIPCLNQQECLDIDSALEVLTHFGALQLHINEKKGSITIDKDADFVIISNDVLTMEPQRIHTTRVLSTYVHGQKVWSSI